MPVNRSGNLELEVMQGRKLTVEVVGPIGDDRIERDVFGDAEVQVDVGPAVLSAVRRRLGHRIPRDQWPVAAGRRRSGTAGSGRR
jgi:hypothetical protein